MTTTDDTALQEQIARAIHSATERPGSICRTGEADWDFLDSDAAEEYRAEADAVLPILRAARADALREASAHISETVDNAKPWQVFTEHVLHEAGVCDYLDRRAADIEKED